MGGAEETEKQLPGQPSDGKRIAVLPLANISADSKDEYFSDGMTEELISAVSKIRGLGVIARTSVMRYKGATKPIGEIARELGVGTLLEGSVRKAGNKVRISVQLVNAKTEEQVWPSHMTETWKMSSRFRARLPREKHGH